MDRIKDKITKNLLFGDMIKGLSYDLRRKAKIKLIQVLSARDLKELSIPPSNKLEKLKGNRKEQYSIRINDQYRICFDGKDNMAQGIEFVDYH